MNARILSKSKIRPVPLKFGFFGLGFLSNCTFVSYNTDNRAEKCKELDFLAFKFLNGQVSKFLYG